MRSDLVPGTVFPDYQLPDHTDTPRRLSELQGDDPLILTLARGHYCPKEHQQHLDLAAFYPKIAVAYTQIATISTDDHHTLQEFRASVGAQWTFLSDPDRTVQKHLDIAEYTDPEHNPMIPHTLVLKPGLIIHSIYNGYWFWGRPSVVDLWHDLRAVTREIRPDWDLSAPGLREAWNSGDLSPSMDGTRVQKRLLKARERKRIRLEWIRPRLLDCKARIIQQGAERIPGELVAVLDMDRFKGRELEAKLRGRNTPRSQRSRLHFKNQRALIVRREGNVLQIKAFTVRRRAHSLRGTR